MTNRKVLDIPLDFLSSRLTLIYVEYILVIFIQNYPSKEEKIFLIQLNGILSKQPCVFR